MSLRDLVLERGQEAIGHGLLVPTSAGHAMLLPAGARVGSHPYPDSGPGLKLRGVAVPTRAHLVHIAGRWRPPTLDINTVIRDVGSPAPNHPGTTSGEKPKRGPHIRAAVPPSIADADATVFARTNGDGLLVITSNPAQTDALVTSIDPGMRVTIVPSQWSRDTLDGIARLLADVPECVRLGRMHNTAHVWVTVTVTHLSAHLYQALSQYPESAVNLSALVTPVPG